MDLRKISFVTRILTVIIAVLAIIIIVSIIITAWQSVDIINGVLAIITIGMWTFIGVISIKEIIETRRLK